MTTQSRPTGCICPLCEWEIYDDDITYAVRNANDLYIVHMECLNDRHIVSTRDALEIFGLEVEERE